MNQEFTLTLKHIVIIWFIGFTCGAPFMNLLVNIKYGSSVVIPIINFLIMAGVSGAGIFILRKKNGVDE